jgi:hypothetical protein
LRAKSGQFNALDKSSLTDPEQQFAHPEHAKSTSEQKKYAVCMQQLPPNLRIIVEAWEDLPPAVRAGILAMVRTVIQK